MNPHEQDKTKTSSKADDLLAGRGAPAFMSSKDPAIRLLRERYSESFAITTDSVKGQAYLFLVKLGLWSLVATFTRRDYTGVSKDFGIPEGLQIIEEALTGKNSVMLERLDSSVQKALARIKTKVDQFKKD